MKDLSKQAVLAAVVLQKAMAWYEGNISAGHIPGEGEWDCAQQDEKDLHAACAELADAE